MWQTPVSIVSPVNSMPSCSSAARASATSGNAQRDAVVVRLERQPHPLRLPHAQRDLAGPHLEAGRRVALQRQPQRLGVEGLRTLAVAACDGHEVDPLDGDGHGCLLVGDGSRVVGPARPSSGYRRAHACRHRHRPHPAHADDRAASGRPSRPQRGRGAAPAAGPAGAGSARRAVGRARTQRRHHGRRRERRHRPARGRDRLALPRHAAHGRARRLSLAAGVDRPATAPGERAAAAAGGISARPRRAGGAPDRARARRRPDGARRDRPRCWPAATSIHGGQALVHLLFQSCQAGATVRGPVVRGRQTFVLTRDWLGSSPAGELRGADRDRALAELARRYLRGHGPATPADLALWAGLPLRDARAGFARHRRRAARDRDDGDADPRRSAHGGAAAAAAGSVRCLHAGLEGPRVRRARSPLPGGAARRMDQVRGDRLRHRDRRVVVARRRAAPGRRSAAVGAAVRGRRQAAARGRGRAGPLRGPGAGEPSASRTRPGRSPRPGR